MAFNLYGLYFRSSIHFLYTAKKYHKRVSLKEMPKYNQSKKLTGCTSFEYFIYEFDRKNIDDIGAYLTEKRKNELIRIIGDSTSTVTMFGSKKLFNERFSEYIGRKWLDPLLSSFEEFCNFIYEHEQVIIKPDHLLQGRGIFIFNVLNDKKSLAELYDYCKSNNSFVEEVIKQHPDMDRLNHGSVNTIRISTLYANDSVHIVSTALRIGGGNSCTDNFNNNGFGCAIDAETGAVISDGYNKSLKILPVHPVSGIVFKEIVIPMWDQVISLTKDAAKKACSYPKCKWLAWDIAITDKPTIVEGNWGQGADIIQVGQNGIYNTVKQLLAINNDSDNCVVIA